jgi:ribosome-binding factor A
MKNTDYQKFLENMKIFLKLCMKELNLKKLPRIVWVTDNQLKDKTPTFGIC